MLNVNNCNKTKNVYPKYGEIWLVNFGDQIGSKRCYNKNRAK